MADKAQANLRFTSRTFHQIIERLAGDKSVFTLHVSDAPDEKVVYFVSGGVRLLSTGNRAGDDVESRLLRSGRIEVEELHEALESSRKGHSSLKESLVARGALSAEEYDAVAADLIRRELHDLVLWHDAYYTCYTGSPPQEIYGRNAKALIGQVDCERLEKEIEELAKVWERARHVLLSDRAVLEANRKGRFGLEKAQGDDRACLEHTLQPAELRTLWRNSGLELADTLQALERLVGRGWVDVTPPAELDDAGEIARLEECLDSVIGKDLVREKLVALYRRTGRDGDAAKELQDLATAALRNAQWPLAAERLQQALAIRPTELEILERVVGIYLDQNQERDAVQTANQHAHRLLEAGHPDEARTVAKLVRRMTGRGLDADCIAAAVSADRGDVESAVEQYLRISHEYEERGERRPAIRILRQALEVCPGNERVTARLEALDPEFAESRRTETRERGRRERSGRLRRALVWSRRCAAVLALVAGGWGLHAAGLLPFGPAPAEAGADRVGSPAPAGGTDRPGGPAGVDEGPGRDRSRSHRPAGQRPGLDPRALSGASEVDAEGRAPSPAPPSREVGRRAPRESPREALEAEVPGERATASRRVLPGGRDHAARTPAPRGTDDGRAPRSGRAGTRARRLPPAPERPAGSPGERDPELGSVAVAPIPVLPHVPRVDWTPGGGGLSDIPARIIDKARWAVTRGSEDAGVRVRRAAKDLLVAWARARPLVGLRPGSGGVVFRVTGRREGRWAVGHAGRRVCRWSPGERALLYNTVNRTERATRWRFPEDTEAVAVGERWLAIRQGERTTLVRPDGTAWGASVLPRWHEGAFLDDLLILIRHRSGPAGPAGLWAIHPGGWYALWSCTEREGRFEVR